MLITMLQENVPGVILSTTGVRIGNIDTLAIALLLLMALDYCAGMAVAKRRNKWSKKAAIDGLFKKSGIILLVIASFIVDKVLPLLEGYVLPDNVNIDSICQLLMVIFIATEFRSIVKNAGRLGQNIPDILNRFLLIKDDEDTSKCVDHMGDKFDEDSAHA